MQINGKQHNINSGADLSGADLSGADLSFADLRGADLRGAYLRDADLSFANLSGADLRGANLSGANLSCADLNSADLRGAYLRGTDLSGADLSGAYLSFAYLSFADLRGAKNIFRISGQRGSSGRDLIANMREVESRPYCHVYAGCWGANGEDGAGGTLAEFRERVNDVYGIDHEYHDDIARLALWEKRRRAELK